MAAGCQVSAVMAVKIYRWFLFICIFSIIIVLILWTQWPHTFNENKEIFFRFDNVTGVEVMIVPNIVHFVIFGKDTLDFTSFLSILAVMKIQRPEKVLMHTDQPELMGRYWLALQSLQIPNTSLEINHLSRPTHVFGQPLSSIYHASDVARIQVLMQYGGIYLDADTLVLRNLDRFRHFEIAVGWPTNDYLGTQIIVAHKDARFLRLWQNCYRRYHPREWYFNAGQLPTQLILEHDPSLVHRVPYLFGVQNLAAQLYGLSKWPQWRTMYAVHLLSRHPPAPQLTDEKLVRRFRSPYGEIARWLLYKVEPAEEILH